MKNAVSLETHITQAAADLLLEVLGNIVFSAEGRLRNTLGPLQEEFTQAMQAIFCDTIGRARDEALRAYRPVLSSILNHHD